MNKILLDKDKLSIDGDSCISYLVENVYLTINNTLSIIDETKSINKNINIEMNDNTSLKYYKDYCYDDLDIFIKVGNNCHLDFNIVSTIKSKYKINIILDIIGNDNDTKVVTKMVCEDNGEVTIKVDGNVYENTMNNTLFEDIKILHLNDYRSEIIPNMRVYSNSVNATHNAVISGLNKDILFYLQSKGLDNTASTDLIKQSFLNIKREVENE